MSISRTQVRVSDARAAHSEEVDRAEYELLWFTLARSLFVSVRRTQYYKHKQRQLHAIAMNERNEPPTESGLFCAVIYDTPDLNRNQRQSESNEAQEKRNENMTTHEWTAVERSLSLRATHTANRIHLLRQRNPKNICESSTIWSIITLGISQTTIKPLSASISSHVNARLKKKLRNGKREYKPRRLNGRTRTATLILSVAMFT